MTIRNIYRSFQQIAMKISFTNTSKQTLLSDSVKNWRASLPEVGLNLFIRWPMKSSKAPSAPLPRSTMILTMRPTKLSETTKKDWPLNSFIQTVIFYIFSQKADVAILKSGSIHPLLAAESWKYLCPNRFLQLGNRKTQRRGPKVWRQQTISTSNVF